MMFRKQPRPILAAVDLKPSEVEITVDQRCVIDRGLGLTEKLLRDLRRDEVTLEMEIAERTEKLRQTRVAIEAFAGAEQTLSAGSQERASPAAVIVAAVSERLVPREVNGAG